MNQFLEGSWRFVRACVVFLVALLTTASIAAAQTQETEPNNTPATANSAVRGGKVAGTLTYRPGDASDDAIDWWVLTASAGDTIFVDVDANEFGSALDASIALYASDGITQLSANSNWDGFDPYLAYVATTSGQYYIRIQTGPGPSRPQPYTIKFTEARCPQSSEEPEPDDTPAQAVPLSLGQTVHGHVCPMSDGGLGNIDYFKFQASAGTGLEVQVDTVGRERPVFACACQITPFVQLWASDGTTELARTNEYDYPKRFEYQVTTAGTYYVSVNMWPAGIRYPYALRVRAMSAPPGDPAVVRAEGLGEGWAVLPDPHGDFIVSDRLGGRVWWVALDGRKQVIAHDIPRPGGLGWDAFGNLLISSPDAVYKLDPQGHVSQFIAQPGINWMAVGLDGTLWLTEANPPSLRHYDPVGRPLETIDVASLGTPFQVAISPAGDVYFSVNAYNGEVGLSTAIYRLSGGQPQQVLRHDGGAWGFAMDVDGNFYVSSPNLVGLGTDPTTSGRIYLYDHNGQALAEPFATGFNGPTGVAFGRNEDGSMNSRLFTVERDGGSQGKLKELNPTSIRARGATVGYATSAQVVADLLKSGGVLSETQRHFLDNIGNQNGRYDVGDLRAFLILTSTLSATSPVGTARQRGTRP